MEKELTALVNAINTVGGSAGILIGVYMAWKAFERIMEWKLGPQKRSNGELGRVFSLIEEHRRDDIASHSTIAQALNSVTKQLERCEEAQRDTARVLERLTDRVDALGEETWKRNQVGRPLSSG